MDATATAGGFLRFFADVPDPRTGNHIAHKLHDLIVIAILAVICGADGWVQVQLWGKCKHKWLATFLDLPGGIPSHDTFSRVFARLDPDAFERCFLAWMAAVVELSGGRLVAIDGKAIRRSFERGWDKSGMAHLVSALVSQGGNRLVFGQLAVADKSNEIMAIPKLLELLDLRGAVVTIDAIGCQRDIAGKIVQAGAGYLLAVKENQPQLHAKLQSLMNDLMLDHTKQVSGSSGGGGGGTRVGYDEQREQGHGRIETRRVWVSDQVQDLGPELLAAWPGLTTGSIALIQRTRQDLGDFSGKVSVERQLYISTLSGADDAAAQALGGYARGHWSVENNLHWQLDVSFGEDLNRTRKGHGAQNYSRLCRIALNLLKRDNRLKASIKSKRLNAGWDHDYLLRLINQ
jgi:predicted transposase YbfD/YdcC